MFPNSNIRSSIASQSQNYENFHFYKASQDFVAANKLMTTHSGGKDEEDSIIKSDLLFRPCIEVRTLK
jgi:hypothetical protein